MALRTTEDSDTKLNPGQSDYDRKFNGIAATEEAGTFDDIVNNYDDNADDSQENDNIAKARDAEQNPDNGFRNNYTGKNNSSKINGKVNFLKRKGPMGAIIGLLVGGGFGLAGLMSPGLLIVQMKEVMVNKFNTQLTSMELRSNKIINNKINGATSGVCSSVVTIACKYSSVSDKQIKAFRDAGIEVEGNKTLGGRTKPTNFKFNGEDISPSEFNSLRNSNPAFNRAVRNAYNPKYAGFADEIWSKFAAKIGIKKTPGVSGETDTERAQSLDEEVKSGTTETTSTHVTTNDIDPETDKPYTPEKVAQINDAADKFAAEAGAGIKAGESALSEVEPSISAGAKSLGNFFKVTGVADNACQAYGAVQTLGFAAKTVRAVQLARYAMAFLNIADQIKAGTAKPGDVAYFGGILTSIAYDAKSAVKNSRGAATDSFGYKFAAYGDVGVPDNFVAQFMAGGGLTGDLIRVTSAIKSVLQPVGGIASCKTLANPWVQTGSIIAGIGLMLIPGGQVAFGAKEAGQLALQVSYSVAMLVLPQLLKDIVAGTVTKGIVGADSGNGFTSGAGSLMGGLANEGGNAAMTKPDAMAYNDAQTQVVASYNRDDASKLSPFDATNSNTFLGSIVSSLIPYYSRLNTVGGTISSIGSLVSSSFASIFPKSSAASTTQYQESLDSCQDYDYQSLGIATDPFCNVIYGIPPRYLNKDPMTVLSDLTTKNQVDATTGNPVPGSDYEAFISKCIGRSTPLGPSTTTVPNGDGTGCIITDSNADYYLYFIDRRIQNDIDGVDSSTTSTSSANIPSSALYQDSTNLTCAPGTTDAGAAVGYFNMQAINVRLCEIPGTVDASSSNQPMKVNARVSGAFLSLVGAMGSATGSPVKIASSFRTMAEQEAAYKKYGPTRAAEPGTSNHQMGLAVDFQLSTGDNGATKVAGTDKIYDWLTANASTYGIAKLSTEAWHWQAAGAQ